MTVEGCRVLVAYSSTSTHTQTTMEYLSALGRYLPYHVDYLHVTNGAVFSNNLQSYHVIINSYCARHCFDGYVSPRFLQELQSFRGLKILAIQDEYENTNLLKARVLELGFDVVFTCIPRDRLEYVFPSQEFGHVRFENALTGYVPDNAADIAPATRPLAERPIVVGYRARDLGGLHGQLGFDKLEIGRRMKEICDARGIPNDIAMDDASRIYGTGWYDFVGSCRSMLGTETGSNVFDFDGSLRHRFDAMTARAGGVQPSYDEFRPYIGDRESEMDIGQISPRIFEYVSLRTPMILFRGRYSDAIVPDEHYLALERDFSNVDDVLGRLDNLDALAAMAERVFGRLIASGDYGYRAFVDSVSRVIEAELARPRRGPAPEVSDAPAPGPEKNIHPALLYAPTRVPTTPDDFKMRENYLGFETEAARMIRQEAFVLEGFQATIRPLRNRLVHLRGTAADAVPAEASVNAFSGLLSECEATFAQMRQERDAERVAIDEGRRRSSKELGEAMELHSRQVHTMWHLYGRMDTLYGEAADAVARAEDASERVPPTPNLRNNATDRRFLTRMQSGFARVATLAGRLVGAENPRR